LLSPRSSFSLSQNCIAMCHAQLLLRCQPAVAGRLGTQSRLGYCQGSKNFLSPYRPSSEGLQT
jgi:hypothetical protein